MISKLAKLKSAGEGQNKQDHFDGGRDLGGDFVPLKVS